VKADSKDIRILVVGDNVDNVRQVRSALNEEFSSVEVSVREADVVADFEKILPEILVLAFDTLEKAQRYSLGLLRLSKVAPLHRHFTVILCSGQEVRVAFELCKKDYFDDYVHYWPHAHDGHRLLMAVWNGRRRIHDDDRAADDGAGAAARAANARLLEAMVDRQLNRGMTHVEATEASLVGADRALGRTPIPVAARQALDASRAHLAPMSAWADDFRAELAPHVARANEGAEGKRPIVLVVEDDAFAAKLIVKTLEAQPYDIELAADAHAALVALRRARPRLILMDVNLPGMDGMALTEWLKSSAAHKAIPVIMLTSEARRETIERSKAAGAAGFIVKPFTRDALIAKLAPFMSTTA